MMKCWKFNMHSALHTWWGQYALRFGALFIWMKRLRKTNGPNFFWPLMMFAGALPERLMIRMGKLYGGRPLEVKTRAELLASDQAELLEVPARRHWRRAEGSAPPGSADTGHDWFTPGGRRGALNEQGRNAKCRMQMMGTRHHLECASPSGCSKRSFAARCGICILHFCILHFES
jgi:hypothetical protein